MPHHPLDLPPTKELVAKRLIEYMASFDGDFESYKKANEKQEPLLRILLECDSKFNKVFEQAKKWPDSGSLGLIHALELKVFNTSRKKEQKRVPETERLYRFRVSCEAKDGENAIIVLEAKRHAEARHKAPPLARKQMGNQYKVAKLNITILSCERIK